MSADEPSERLRAAVIDLLRDGPRPTAWLVAQADAMGLVDYLRDDGVPDDALADALDEDVIVTDEVWATPTDVLARTDLLLDGFVLTHRLTEDEIIHGEVAVLPDLTVLDWDARDGLELASGGRLRAEFGSVEVGEDGSTLVGPRGWLDEFEPGDVLAFWRSAGDRVRVDWVEPAALGDGSREIAALRVAGEGRIPPGEGEEVDPVVLDVLVADPAAFRAPVPPLGELMVAAGFERLRFQWGRAGEDWTTASVRAQLYRRTRLALEWRFGACCNAAFDTVADAYHQFEATRAAPPSAEVAKALGHHEIAPAFAEYTLADGLSTEAVRAFADALVGSVPARQSVGARLVAAKACLVDGEAGAAESLLRAALDAEPDYGPAAEALVDFELDRGNIDRALVLLHHARVEPDTALIAFLEEERASRTAPFRGVGRNDACPCGSGRKFKTCCAVRPQVPLSERTRLLMVKLVRYAQMAHSARIVGIASSACDPDDDNLVGAITAMRESPFIVDVALWEGGIAEDYLDERGTLLPADEAELVAELLDTRRRVWEITAVDPGRALEVRDTATGDVAVVHEQTGSTEAEVGELLLGRLATVGDERQFMGALIDIPLRLRGSALEVFAADAYPSAEEIADWYGWATQPPAFSNTEGEPMLLCEIELRTALDLDALHAALDDVFESDERGEWREIWLNQRGERIVRGLIRYDDGALRVDANSAARADRLVAALQAAIVDAEVVSDVRRSANEAMGALQRDASLGTQAELPDEVHALLDDMMRQKEREWVDESIPALGGLTPREAADDPTRREDLLALLRELEAATRRTGDSGRGAGFDAARLRELLGL